MAGERLAGDCADRWLAEEVGRADPPEPLRDRTGVLKAVGPAAVMHYHEIRMAPFANVDTVDREAFEKAVDPHYTKEVLKTAPRNRWRRAGPPPVRSLA